MSLTPTQQNWNPTNLSIFTFVFFSFFKNFKTDAPIFYFLSLLMHSFFPHTYVITTCRITLTAYIVSRTCTAGLEAPKTQQTWVP